MPKRLTLEPHLSSEELKQRYRKALDPVERSHYQILWLLAQGKTTTEIRAVTGYSINWIRTLIHRYNKWGIEGMRDSRHDNPGAETLLDDLLQAQLLQVLQTPPSDGGLWNGRKVAQWMSEVLGRPVSRQRGWEYLRSLELRLRIPRPEHEESDPLEQEAWKKKLAARVAQIQQTHPTAQVEVWAMDEHRIGLKPVQRRVWAPMGFPSVAQVKWDFEWLWLYGFVHPQSGETYWWILPRVNFRLFNRVLADFAHEFNLGKDKHIILTVDRASWHTTEQVVLPPGLHLELMPSYSPELQPAERLWPLTNEPIANRSFVNLDELEETVFQRCRTLLKQRQFIQGLTCFHWWPKVAA